MAACSHLRNENVSDQPPDFAVHDRDRIEIEQAEITRIHFLEYEDKCSEKADVTEQAGNGQKADAPFKFVQPRHIPAA